MAQPSAARGRKAADIHNDYETFVNKFKPKHTTDSCNTPTYIYDTLLQYLKDQGHITPDTPIIRPFWPDADYTHLDQYPQGSVVVDNPPFSILSQIVRYYNTHNIPYFLFAPSLTAFGLLRDNQQSTIIILDLNIIYQNGANVNTCFVTNLPTFQPYAAITDPDLYRHLYNAQATARREQNKKTVHPSYQYPDNLVTATILHRIAHHIPFQIPRDQSQRITALDAQRPHHKSIFGSGLLISNPLAAQLKAAQLRAAQLQSQTPIPNDIRLINDTPTFTFPLSPREQNIIENLENQEK